jgi:hypothetical protein
MSEPWFKPKAYGYGAQPANWKGWLATLVYAAALLGLAYALFANRGGQPPDLLTMVIWFATVGVLTLVFVAFAKAKTGGEWRWRWGKPDK